ncbi:MAG: cytochrome c peroxidase, partial [Pseudomonadota bacterium]
MKNKLSITAASIFSLLLFSGAALSKELVPLADSDFHDNGAPGETKVELGRFLMFDKILSGNQNISCATCH